MKLYSAIVRLLSDREGNNVYNEVFQTNATAAELRVLEFVHEGKQATLRNVEHTGSVNRSDKKERIRLAGIYTKTKGDTKYTGEDIVEKLFGHVSVPLPQEYEAPTAQAVEVYGDDDEDEDEIIEPISRSPIADPTDVESLTG